jgi:hypothetical protein
MSKLFQKLKKAMTEFVALKKSDDYANGYQAWKRDVVNHILQNHVRGGASQHLSRTNSVYLRLNNGKKIRLSDHPHDPKTEGDIALSLVYPGTNKTKENSAKHLAWDTDLPAHNWQEQVDNFFGNKLQKSVRWFVIEDAPEHEERT